MLPAATLTLAVAVVPRVTFPSVPSCVMLGWAAESEYLYVPPKAARSMPPFADTVGSNANKLSKDITEPAVAGVTGHVTGFEMVIVARGLKVPDTVMGDKHWTVFAKTTGLNICVVIGSGF